MFIKAISRCNYISNKFKVSHNTRRWSHLLAGGINDLTVQWSVWILSLTCSMWWWLLWSSHSSQCVHFLRLLLMVSGNSTMFSYDHRRSNVYYHYRNVVFCTTMSLDKKSYHFSQKKVIVHQRKKFQIHVALVQLGSSFLCTEGQWLLMSSVSVSWKPANFPKTQR